RRSLTTPPSTARCSKTCSPASTAPPRRSFDAWRLMSNLTFPDFRAPIGNTRSPPIEYGNGARLENGYLVLFTMGRRAVRYGRALVPSQCWNEHDRDDQSRG